MDSRSATPQKRHTQGCHFLLEPFGVRGLHGPGRGVKSMMACRPATSSQELLKSPRGSATALGSRRTTYLRRCLQPSAAAQSGDPAVVLDPLARTRLDALRDLMDDVVRELDAGAEPSLMAAFVE